ncbi:LRR receptor-like serine/threonine-protein kinase GSO2 isoform X8 [Physcomitrium patens]|uniref:LRR receptor-like serine/threonine-protein kinase GSO2 isoform X8 n=1 Tax=Physcomitrium patens TaxID=3218 RepID=UPI003CCE2D3C
MGLKLGVGKYSLVHQSCFVAALIVLLGTLPTCDGQTTTIYNDNNQVDALKDLLRAWNQTPNLETTLAKWDMDSTSPCLDGGNWRGVQCLINCTSYGKDQNCYSYIIGVTLQSASLVGSIPSTIGHITTLYRLELTGNPDLTGPLPGTLNQTSLAILDVHDNALKGELPEFGVHFIFLLTLDLSSNKFNGTLPNLTMIHSLRTVRDCLGNITQDVAQCILQEIVNIINNQAQEFEQEWIYRIVSDFVVLQQN